MSMTNLHPRKLVNGKGQELVMVGVCSCKVGDCNLLSIALLTQFFIQVAGDEIPHACLFLLY